MQKHTQHGYHGSPRFLSVLFHLRFSLFFSPSDPSVPFWFPVNDLVQRVPDLSDLPASLSLLICNR